MTHGSQQEKTKDYKGSNKAQIHESQAIVPFKPIDCPLPSRLDQDPDLLDLEDPSLSAFAKVLNGKAFDAEPTADTRKNITKRPSLVGLRMSDSSPESVKKCKTDTNSCEPAPAKPENLLAEAACRKGKSQSQSQGPGCTRQHEAQADPKSKSESKRQSKGAA